MIDDDALLDRLLAEAGVVDTAAPARPRRREPGSALRLSYAQEVLWLLDRSTPGMTAYNVRIARRIVGPLDRTRLQIALDGIVARHEVLRTRFPAVDGEPAPIVDPARKVELRFVDLAGVEPAQRAARADAFIAERARTAFDLEREHLFRATLLRCEAVDHILLLETHHLVWDGLSLAIFERELSALYAAQERGSGLPALDFQYADYAAWQRETIAGDALAALVSYWRDQLADHTEPLVLPADFPQAAIPSAESTQRSIAFDAATALRVRELARANGATVYMVLLAACATVLHRYTSRSNIIVGSNVAARMQAEFADLIGYFTNTLPLRADCSGDPSFVQLLGRVRDMVLGAYDHQNVPLEALVQDLQEDDANLGRAPLYNVVLTSRGEASQAMTLGNEARIEPYGVEHRTTKFDLTLFLGETAEGLHLTLRARAGLWSPPTVERFLMHLRSILDDALRTPGAKISHLALMAASERAELEMFNAAVSPVEAPTVVALMTSAARRAPGRIAVRSNDETLEYCDLDERSNRLARHLQSLGVTDGSVVGILLERSIEAAVAIFGVLKAGAAYAPLALDQPAARLGAQLAACGASVVVTLAAEGRRLSGTTVVALDGSAASFAGQSSEPLAVALHPESAAYVLFTSGSTGVPKPVAVTHANIARYTRAITRVMANSGGDAAPDAERALDGWHCGMTSTLAADLGNTVLYPALCGGGTLHVISHELATDAERFAAYRTRHALDVLKMTPSHLRALLGALAPDARETLLPERCLLLGGERFAWDLADELQALLETRPHNRCRVFNHYGPTETTVGASTFLVSDAAQRAARAAGSLSVPIGKPLDDVQLFVCDAHGAQLPVGIPGELYVGGAGVTRGYLGRPDETNERFVSLPGKGRAYRTGDRVRRVSTGDVEFLGRMDEQVKIRGFRVEPGEIEAVFAAHSDVARVAVLARPVAGTDEPMLVAYVVANGASDGVAERLHAFAAERLSAHMLPAAIVPLKALPLTKNGKLDRRALPDPVLGGAAKRIEPRTPLERELMQIWMEIFKREAGGFGVTDNFFSLGGQSLLAIRLLGKISRLRGVRLSLRTLFDHPTIEELATALDAQAAPQTERIGRAAGRSAQPSQGAALTW